MAILSWISHNGVVRRSLGDQTRIGRLSDNDIQIHSPHISGHHARILHLNGVWILEDLQSTNGSFVNGEKTGRSVLRDEDKITIGDEELSFYLDALPSASIPNAEKQSPAGSPAGKAQGPGYAVPANLSGIFKDTATVTKLQEIDSFFAPSRTAGMEVHAKALEQRLNACYEISKATAGSLSLSDVLDRILLAVFEIFENADRSFVLLVDPQTQEVTVGAVKRRDSNDEESIVISRTVLEQAMQKRQAILCRDALTDESYSKAQSIIAMAIRSMMIAPLVFGEQVLGAIQVDTRSAIAQFTQADLELLSVAASQVAACVNNARLLETLVASERLAAVGQTVAGLTHCIKNILQGVQGGSFMLEKALQKEDVDKVRTAWEMVKKNNSFMEELVFDLLSYSKQRYPEYESVDLNALCREICEFASLRAEAKGIAVEFVSAQKDLPVELDPKGMRRCILNLVMNAVDACAQKDGKVTVATDTCGNKDPVLIRIHDTGCGMPEEIKEKLFTVFFSTKGSKGTGLGLPVTKKIVEEHGGRIEVDSRMGEGTTFTITLPPDRRRKTEARTRKEKK